MGRPRNHSEAEVLERAIDVFWANGFEGTSITDLVTRLGINRSTMYAFFGDKEALYQRALTEYARRLAADREARLVCLDDPLAGISRWLYWMADGAAGDPSRRGCFIGAAALERLPEHAGTASVLDADTAQTERLLTESLNRARDQGQVRDDLDIPAAAALLLTVYQGIKILAKAEPGSPTPRLACDAALSALTSTSTSTSRADLPHTGLRIAARVVSTAVMVTPDIPLLDISVFREGDPAQRERLAARLDQALRQSGFLMIENHGIPAGLREEIRAQARAFFALPYPRKAKYATAVAGRGWIPPGGEANAFYGEVADPARADMKESLTIGRNFRTGDAATDAAWFAPNLWPAEYPELEGLCEQFTAAVRELYYDLLRLSASALGLAPDWFVAHARRAPHTFNINRYPPLSVTGPPRPGQFRVAPHTDWGILTVLDRQPGYGGLQVQAPDGTWADAPYAPDAFTVNVADLMSRWTGERWRSTRHRVLPPSPRAPDEELISLIVFLEAEVDTVIAPIAGAAAGGRDFEPVVAGQWLRAREAAATVPAERVHLPVTQDER